MIHTKLVCVLLLAIINKSNATFGCFPFMASCWPTTSDIDDLISALEPNSTRLLIQTYSTEPDVSFVPKIQPLLDENVPNRAISSQEAAQPLYGLGLTQMQPVYRRTDYTQTCRDIGLYESDFCKAAARNNWLNTDPDFVIFPLTVEHIQTALQFAKDHNLNVAVAGAGHEFNGRNQAWGIGGSILIRTSLMRSKSADLTDAQGFGYPSATFGAGIIANDAQHFAMLNGHEIATGICDTTGLVGWSIGGGHGPFAPTLGFGADNLLAVDIVLANGSHVRADSTGPYADLYKALRGGGGSTWGIITQITIRLHPVVPSDGGVTFLFASLASGTIATIGDAGPQATIKNMTDSVVTRLLASGKSVSSNVLVTNSLTPDLGVYNLIWIRYVHGGADVQDAIDDYLAVGVPREAVMNATLPHQWILMNVAVSRSRLIPFGDDSLASVLVKRSDAHKLRDTLAEIVTDCDGTSECITGLTTSLTGKDGSPQAEGTSLSEGMRTSWGWVYSNKKQAQEDFLDDYGESIYLSEASPYIMNPNSYGPMFWGDNYESLKETKDKYDPDRVFGCRQCVN